MIMPCRSSSLSVLCFHFSCKCSSLLQLHFLKCALHLFFRKSGGLLWPLHGLRAPWQRMFVVKLTHTAWPGVGFKNVFLHLPAHRENKLLCISTCFMANCFHSQLCQDISQISYSHHPNLVYSTKFK